VTDVWVVVAVTAVGTIALKGAGPVLLGGRPLPPRLDGVVRLAGPALLAALIATSTFGQGQSLVVDERVLGVAAAAVAVRFHAPALLVVVVAAVTTGVIRALTG
jgi:branched chain amino acid efflux pump